MCRFFSLTSDGEGNIAYFNREQRQKIISGEIEGNYNADSHTSINDYYGFKGAAKDKRNKYKYNPLTGEFTIEMINTTDDSRIVEKAVRELDFKMIVEPLIIKPIVHPLKLPKVEAVTEHHISLLRKWASVRDSIGSSVWNSVGGSVWDSVYAYISSFFKIEKWYNIDHEPYVNPFQCCIDLWETGLIPSYSIKMWRLHSGEKADIVWQGSFE